MDNIGRCIFLLLFFISIQLFSSKSHVVSLDKKQPNGVAGILVDQSKAAVTTVGTLVLQPNESVFYKKEFPFFKDASFTLYTLQVKQHFVISHQTYPLTKPKVFYRVSHPLYPSDKEDPLA